MACHRSSPRPLFNRSRVFKPQGSGKEGERSLSLPQGDRKGPLEPNWVRLRMVREAVALGGCNMSGRERPYAGWHMIRDSWKRMLYAYRMIWDVQMGNAPYETEE